MEKMQQNNIKVRKGNRYMEDIRAMLKALRMVWRWHGGWLCFTETWKTEDEQAGKSPTLRTANALLSAMNELYDFLEFTQEIGEDSEDGKLASLDTKIWVSEGMILFEFFNKPMATNLCVQADSALSEETRLSSLAEEFSRRLRNTSRRIETSKKIEIFYASRTKSI